jgi:DNA primase
MDSTRFKRELLPNAIDYFDGIGNPLKGSGTWRSALCPFHNDHRPSLRVLVERGAYCCMACGAKGGDLLSFHMERTGKGFIEAARDLGAWE